MILYWDVKFDNRKFNEVDQGISVYDFSKARLCEVYFSTEFLKKIKFKIDFTIKNYWKSVANFFFVVDTLSIDIFWFKYNRLNERRKYQNEKRKSNEEFYFSDWMNCYNDLSNYSINQEEKNKTKNIS